MWEQGLSLAWGTVVMWAAWTISVGLVLVGWRIDEPSMGQTGIVFCAIGACLTVIRDNANTRRVVRAVAREDKVRAI